MTVVGRTHRPVVNPELCQRCSVCVRDCPAEVFPELRSDQDTARGTVYTTADVLTRSSLPPCQDACPIGQQVREYIHLLAAGQTREALLTVRKDNPLPGISGCVCHHPCEQACVRGSWDDPVAIRELKRSAVQYEMAHTGEILDHLQEQKQPPRGQKVTIIGAGPAGLACAFELAMAGCEVALLDALERPGGMLSAAIPPFRLPREIIEHDVDMIQSLGVRFTGSIRLGRDITIEEAAYDTDAVVVATGTWKDQAMGIPGETAKGCFSCLPFLDLANTGQLTSVKGTVAVIGGGNAALDTARSALRLGPDRVTIIYRRSREEMPAGAEEIEAALQEGVELRFQKAPARMIEDQGTLTGMELVSMELGELDGSGRRRPVPVTGSEVTEQVDTVIFALGQQPELAFLPEAALAEQGTISCTPAGMVTGYDKVAAAGDALSGPSTVVEAMASGKQAARSIIDYLESKTG